MKKTPFPQTKKISKFAFALLLAICFLPQIINAQKLDWVSLAANQNPSFDTIENIYNSLLATQISIDGKDNSYSIGGYTGSLHFNKNIIIKNNPDSINYSSFILSNDKNGQFRWVISPKDPIWFYGIGCDAYGNIYVTGYASTKSSINGISLDSMKAFVLKCDSSGNIKWVKEYGNVYTRFTNISVLSNGNIYLSGYFRDSSTQIGKIHLSGNAHPFSNYFIGHFDSTGVVIWAKNIASNPLPSNIGVDSAGSSYQLCEFANDSTCLIKLNANGTFAWEKLIHGVLGFYGNIAVEPSGNTFIQIAGISLDSLYNLSSSNSDSTLVQNLLVKYDSSSIIKWAKPFSPPNYFSLTIPPPGTNIAIDLNGHIYTSYDLQSNGQKNDIFSVISEFNNLGILDWTDTVLLFSNASNTYWLNSIVSDNNNSLFMLGVIDTFSSFFQLNPSNTGLIVAKLQNKDTSIANILLPQLLSPTFSLYPNPATQNITLKYSATIPAAYTLSITDITGREVQSAQIQAKTGINISQINVQNLNAGMYIVTLQNDNSVQRVKFIKE